MNTIRVLVVEDEFVTGCEIQGRLQDLGYDVPLVVDTGRDAIDQIADLHPQVVIMDIMLKGDMSGIEAAEEIHQKYNLPVIYLTAHSDTSTIEKAVSTEPFGYLVKPVDERSLHTAIRMALYKHGIDKALRESERKYRGIAELAVDPIVILNRDSSISYANSCAIHTFSLSPDDYEGTNITQIIPQLVIPMMRMIDSVFASGQSVQEVLTGDWGEIEKWYDTTVVPVTSDAGEVIQAITLFHDITILIQIEKEIERKGIKQIEHNMEQFQILNDQIRNPLAIIMSAASLNECAENTVIIEQARKINDLVTLLDQGWIQSDAVRAFLLKHYGHGKDLK